ncbi:ComEA family DNA-binding protein [Streptomyces sp. NPDC049954]|uniref:ComEA family DNA-binding protein n=1 Tax=Streptomyces sp. NPDC049954 TaxID=3155779 RepID=UPI0034351B14
MGRETLEETRPAYGPTRAAAGTARLGTARADTLTRRRRLREQDREALRLRLEGLLPGRSGGPGLAGPDEAVVPASRATDRTGENCRTYVDGERPAPSVAAPAALSPLSRWAGAVRDRLPLWVRTRCAVERRSVLALSAVLLVAAGLAGLHLWSSRPEPVEVPRDVGGAGERRERTVLLPSEEPGGAAKRPQPAGEPEAEAPVPGQGGQALVVDVGGEVRRPGVRRLPSGSRVQDALEAAGGVEKGADLAGLNRARPLVDGELVWVGAPPPGGVPPGGVPPGGGTPGSGAAVGGGGGGALVAAAGPVPLNAASVEQLDALPGVGPVLAQRILDYRTEHGGFRSVDELREVSGIGERRFEDLREQVRL